MIRRPYIEIIGGSAAGVASFFYGAVRDAGFGPSTARALGMLLILGSLLGWVSHRTQRRDRIVFELGRMKGHQEGYSEGRRVGKPIVVPFPAGANHVHAGERSN